MPGAQRDGIQAEIKAKTRKNMPEEVERLKARLVELQQNPIYCPPLPRLQFEDTTPEGLPHDLATGWPNGGLFSDEGGAVLGSHGMSDETATRMLSLTNILWDGRDFTPTRKQAAAQLTGRRFCVFLMIQPALLSGMIQKGGREPGFVARFLISLPESTMGSRFYREPPARWPALERFNLKRAVENAENHASC